MPYLSKHIFLKTLFCPTLGWWLENGKIREEHSPETLYWMEQGKEIGQLARELYPDGIFVYAPDTRTAASLTRELIANPGVRVIFEGTFITGNYVAKADILIRDGNSWDLVEVKSGVQKKEEHIGDMAYTTLVARESGFKPSNIFLQQVSKEYRLGMPPGRLFVRNNCTMEVIEKAGEFLPHLSEVDRIVHSPDEPEPRLTMNCKKCDYFEPCIGKEIQEHIFQIPRISGKTFDALSSRGIVSILDIPDDFKLTDAQKLAVRCVKCGEVHVDPVLREKLDEVAWPAYYLDFETAQTAIPLYPDLAPYDSFPTQYSIHLCDRRGNIIAHRDYLADPGWDCRRELAGRLVRDLEGKGSIITYSSYEKKTINSLSGVFPDLKKPLQALIERIVDLEQFVKCVRHPHFRGRTSIKVVLPALVTDLSYEGLAISNGSTAMVTFALMAQGKMGPAEMEQKRAELLEYCKLDTLAMVRLHEKLHELMEK
jgi:CRISPR/Cas system-associated exonuclease Cas4 (RecB family)